MPILMRRLLSRTRKVGWVMPLIIACFVFFTSWPLMWLAEPPGSQIVQPETYYWFYIVTSTTVGYGDFSPVTPLGQAIGVYVIVGGVATLSSLLAYLSTVLEKRKGARMRGRKKHQFDDHVVILGYHPGRTERIAEMLEHEGDFEIVLGAFDETVDEHPLTEHDRVHFVRGDLRDIDVLDRASVASASVVVIDAASDDQALALLAAVHRATTNNHIVIGIRELERAESFSYIDEDVRCVQWHAIRMLVDEIADPGINQVYNEIMSPGGRDTFSVLVPSSLESTSFGDLQSALGRGYGATVLAVQNSDHSMHVSPAWDLQLTEGDRLFYVGERRLDADELANRVTSA